jgi:Leucine-rich repeat (LRR) protein
LEELYASDNQLEILNLNNCKNIRDIYCRSNNLIGLNLPSFCTNLTNLNCSNNFLTDISFLNKIANPKKIISLSLGSNNFSHDNMGINIRTFSRFTNLTSLSIGNNNKEKLKRDVKNKFVGSLRAFSGMVGLNEIYLPNADVETDLENLPSSLKIIECNGSLMEKLKDFLTENLETKEKKDYSSFRCDYEK